MKNAADCKSCRHRTSRAPSPRRTARKTQELDCATLFWMRVVMSIRCSIPPPCMVLTMMEERSRSSWNMTGPSPTRFQDFAFLSNTKEVADVENKSCGEANDEPLAAVREEEDDVVEFDGL